MTTKSLESLEDILARAMRSAHEGKPVPCRRCREAVLSPATVCDRCDLLQRNERSLNESLATVPEAFRWSAFDAPDLPHRVANREAIAMARARRDQSALLFIGPSGAGKTSLAVATMRDRLVHRPGERALFLPSWRLGDARTRSEDSQPEFVRMAMRSELLVLDDLGADKPVPSNPVSEVLFERHAEGRATWITTWMGPGDVAARYGDGLARRVFERTIPIDCAGDAK